MSIDLKLKQLQDVYISEYFRALDCSRSLTAYLLWKHGEHKSLSELAFIPRDYNDLKTARDSLAATKFLSKARFLTTNVDTKVVALEGFFEAERICKETNQRLRCASAVKPSTHAILSRMSWKISHILTDFTADELIDSCNWGPGSTTLLRRARATHPEKFSVERKITAEAYDFVRPWFHLAYPSWDLTFEIDGASKIVTVDKNAKTDRVIAIEPGMNLWFQKGIGTMIRKRLRRHGIDLNDQSWNQKKARLAAVFNKLATVDFSMASDTIAYALIEQLLPSNWFHLLRSFRTSYGIVDGKPVAWEKFSSMGNGFTFELESLVFYALAVAICEEAGEDETQVSVYGDDVIIPSGAYDRFAEVSAEIGFKVNLSKSYDDGMYRESCGSHYWGSESIKPIFLKESFNGQQSVIASANAIRTSNRGNSHNCCDRRFRNAWRLLAEYLGPKCPRVPYGYGDIGLVENFDASRDYCQPATNGYEGFFVRVWAVQPISREIYGRGLLLTRLKAMGKPKVKSSYYCEVDAWTDLSSSAAGNSVPLPGQVRYAKKRILIPQWVDVGEWA